MKAIDLGTKGPSYPVPVSETDDEPEVKVHYPSIYISDAPDGIFDIPDEGTAVIKYKIAGKSTNERDGKKTASCELEIMSIKPQGVGKVMDNSSRDAEDAIDEYFKKD